MKTNYKKQAVGAFKKKPKTVELWLVCECCGEKIPCDFCFQPIPFEDGVELQKMTMFGIQPVYVHKKCMAELDRIHLKNKLEG